MSEARAVVEAVAAALRVLPPGSPVVLALSGGPDSAALGVAVRRARPDLACRAVHVRHGLRDDAADAALAAAQAARIGVALSVVPVTVPEQGDGPSAAARRARYAALTQACAEDDAALLVGHTADDQAETVLLNLARGAGSRGLGGMRPDSRRGPVRVLRPLLDVRRAAAHALVADVATAADPGNDDGRRRRTRVRTEVLPALARLSGGPGDPVGVLCRSAALARADADTLDAQAQDHVTRMVGRWGPGRAVRGADLARLPEALSSRVVRLLLAQVRVAAGADEGLADLPEQAVAAARTLPSGRAVEVAGGVRVTRGQGWLAAAPTTAKIGVARLRPEVRRGAGQLVPGLGLRLRGGTVGIDDDLGAAASVPPGGRAAHALVRLTQAELEGAVLRGRRPGDRIGTRSVADLLAAAGIGGALRPLMPVLVDGDGRVRWAPGAGGGPDPHAAETTARCEALWLE